MSAFVACGTELRGDCRLAWTMISARDGVPLCLSRVETQRADSARPRSCRTRSYRTAVLLLHGSYTQRGFWVSRKGLGLASFLAARGFDVWLLEKRGHGRSPKTASYARFTAHQVITCDLPAALDCILASTDAPLALVGHSAGGLYALAALGLGLLPRRLAAMVVAGTQLRDRAPWLVLPGVSGLLGMLVGGLGRLPANRLGMGPEPEPAGEVREFLRWRQPGVPWQGPDGVSYLQHAAAARLPLLVMAGAADQQHPPASCFKFVEPFTAAHIEQLELGRSHGFSRDFGHVDMFVSKAAAAEVWPRVADWLEASCTQPSL